MVKTVHSEFPNRSHHTRGNLAVKQPRGDCFSAFNQSFSSARRTGICQPPIGGQEHGSHPASTGQSLAFPCREQESWSDWFVGFEGWNFSLVKKRGNRRIFFSNQEYWAPEPLRTRAWGPPLASPGGLTRILPRWRQQYPLRTLCLPSSPEGL